MSDDLKLPMVGYRGYDDGSVYDQNSHGVYWTSNSDAEGASLVRFDASNIDSHDSDVRANAASVRCFHNRAASHVVDPASVIELTVEITEVGQKVTINKYF